MPGEIVEVYSDGATIGANPSLLGGVWAYCLVNAQGERVTGKAGILRPEDVGGGAVTNNQSELYALVRAILALPSDFDGTLFSDSQISLGRIQQGWALGGIPPMLVTLLREAKAHLALLNGVRYQLLKGHPNRYELAAGVAKNGLPVSEWNVACDEQCRRLGDAYRLALPPAGTAEGGADGERGASPAGAGRADRAPQPAAPGALPADAAPRV